jgi:hypothetical protein
MGPEQFSSSEWEEERRMTISQEAKMTMDWPLVFSDQILPTDGSKQLSKKHFPVCCRITRKSASLILECVEEKAHPQPGSHQHHQEGQEDRDRY